MMTSIADLVGALGPVAGWIVLGAVLLNRWLVRIAAILWINRCYIRWSPSQRRDVRELLAVLKRRRGSG